MPDSGAQQVDALRDRLACPACRYSFRGLPGVVIECPECGISYDVPRLIASQYRGVWWAAPGVSELQQTVLGSLVVLFGAIVLFVTVMVRPDGDGYSMLGALIGVSICLFGVYLWWRLIQRWRGPFRRVRIAMSLLLHAAFVGYVIAIIIMLGAVVALITLQLRGLVALAIGVGLLVVSRFLDRCLARKCIQIYMVQQSSVTPT